MHFPDDITHPHRKASVSPSNLFMTSVVKWAIFYRGSLANLKAVVFWGVYIYTRMLGWGRGVNVRGGLEEKLLAIHWAIDFMS